jgi:hypothetical protein
MPEIAPQEGWGPNHHLLFTAMKLGAWAFVCVMLTLGTAVVAIGGSLLLYLLHYR